MPSPPAIVYFLDEPPGYFGPTNTLRGKGWIFSPTGAACQGVRLRAGGRISLAAFGLTRPDVATRHPAESGALASGFLVELPHANSGPVILEWLDAAGAWHEFWRSRVSAPAVAIAARPSLPPARLAALRDHLAAATAGLPTQLAWRTAQSAVQEWTSHFTRAPTPAGFEVHLDSPAPELTDDRFVTISGWLFNSQSNVRDLRGEIGPAGAVHVIYPLQRPDVVSSAPSAAPLACGFSGMIQLPPGGPGWFWLRLYAESADGSVQLALTRRFFRRATLPSFASRWRARLLLAALAVTGHYRPAPWAAGWRALLRAPRPAPKSASAARRPLPTVIAMPPAPLSPESGPLISLLVPVFNPPLSYLGAMIASVQAQRYPHWELCVADDASTDPRVRPWLEEVARLEPRVRLVFRATNGHIARATNTALGIARGEFVALLDQDDLLAPEALQCVVHAIREQPAARFLYTDRDKVDDEGRHYDVERRGAWNPAMAATHNYLHQFTVLQRSLLAVVGDFRPVCSGAQDLDLYLRCHERLRPGEIVHVPVNAYHWRAHAGSTATRGDQKDYMVAAARRGITDALRRRGWRAEPFLPDFAPFYGLNLHQLRWDPALLLAHPVSVVFVANGTDATRSAAAAQRTVPAVAVQLIRVTSDPVARSDEPWEHVSVPADASLAERCNLGARRARHPSLLFLTAPLFPVTADWLEDLAGWLSVPDVAAAGPRLLTRAGVLRSAGWTIDRARGLPQALFAGTAPEDPGPQFLPRTARDSLLLDPAVLLTRTATFRALGGFDGARFPGNYFVADYCLRLRERGLRSVFTPQATLATDFPAAPASADECAAFRGRHPHANDPWIPAGFFAEGEKSLSASTASRPAWLPGNAWAFAAGWLFLDEPQAHAVLPTGRQVVSGWCWPQAGEVILELAVQHGRTRRLATYGHVRPDLAAAAGDAREFVPVGFDLELDLPAGPAVLEFSALVSGRGWLPVNRLDVSVGPARATLAHGLPAALTPAQWTENFDRLLDAPRGRDLPDRATDLVRHLAWRDAMRHPAGLFHGHWNEPTGAVEIVYGQVEVRGWLFHETQSIRRLAGSFDCGDWLELSCRHDSPAIGAHFPAFPSALRCAVSGSLPVPALSTGPWTLRLWAELSDRSWQLVYVRRCHARPARVDFFQPQPAGNFRRLTATAWALQRALAREKIPGPGWGHAFRVVRERTPRLAPHRPAARPTLPRAASVPARPLILFVSHNLNREGAPLFLLELARHAQTELSAGFALISPIEGPLRKDFEQLGATVRVVDYTALWTAPDANTIDATLAQLTREMDLPAASLVVANTIESFWAVAAAHRAGRPSLFYVHESGVPRLHYLGTLSEAGCQLAAASLAQATAVSFPGTATQAYYTALGSGKNHRIQPGWVDLGALRQTDASRARRRLRARLGLGLADRLVISVGTLCPRKDQLTLINALVDLHRLAPPAAQRCRVLLIGDAGNVYGEQLAAHATRLGVTQVSFVPATPRIADYFAAADIFVLSSFEEGFPRVLLEAMSFALPIAASAVHTIPEIVRPGREALLVPPGDSPALARALQRLLTEEAFARDLGQRARQRVETHFTAEQVLPQHVATLRELAPDLAAAPSKTPARDYPESLPLVS